jgi:hypothetical protein
MTMMSEKRKISSRRPHNSTIMMSNIQIIKRMRKKGFWNVENFDNNDIDGDEYAKRRAEIQNFTSRGFLVEWIEHFMKASLSLFVIKILFRIFSWIIAFKFSDLMSLKCFDVNLFEIEKIFKRNINTKRTFWDTRKLKEVKPPIKFYYFKEYQKSLRSCN